MIRSIDRLPDFQIGAGATDSNILGADSSPIGAGFRDATHLTIFTPAVMAEVATIQVSYDEAAAVWFTYQGVAGVDLTLAAGKATVIDFVGFKKMRIHLGAGAAVAHSFQVVKSVAA